MAAYCIVELNVTDPSWLAEYGPKTQELIDKHGGKYIVRDREAARVEGDSAAPSVVVVLEFPNLEAAKAWHSDPEYQPLIKLRQSGSTGEALIVNGL